LSAAYPEYAWDHEKFPTTPRGYWQDSRILKKALDDVEQRLGIKQVGRQNSVDL